MINRFIFARDKNVQEKYENQHRKIMVKFIMLNT